MTTFAQEQLSSPEFKKAKFLSCFIRQLDDLTEQRAINPFSVLNELRTLEGSGIKQSRTKKSTAFKKGTLLEGLMHKHFFCANHIPHNLQNYWSDPDKLNRAIEKELLESGGEIDAWVFAGKIAERAVSVAYEHKNKEKSLTGDWIIYKRQNSINYYLCLANHSESNEQIYDRFASYAEAEFPELKIKAREA